MAAEAMSVTAAMVVLVVIDGAIWFGISNLRWSGHAASSSLSVGGNRWVGIKQLRLGLRGRVPLNLAGAPGFVAEVLDDGR
jgi:hypothetical protein